MLFVDGKPAGEGKLSRTLVRRGLEPFEIGRESITPFDPAYAEKGEFSFVGTIEKVEFDLRERPRRTLGSSARSARRRAGAPIATVVLP